MGDEFCKSETFLSGHAKILLTLVADRGNVGLSCNGCDAEREEEKQERARKLSTGGAEGQEVARSVSTRPRPKMAINSHNFILDLHAGVRTFDGVRTTKDRWHLIFQSALLTMEY